MWTTWTTFLSPIFLYAPINFNYSKLVSKETSHRENVSYSANRSTKQIQSQTLQQNFNRLINYTGAEEPAKSAVLECLAPHGLVNYASWGRKLILVFSEDVKYNAQQHKISLCPGAMRKLAHQTEKRREHIHHYFVWLIFIWT